MNRMGALIYYISLLVCFTYVQSKIDVDELKCLVCEASVKELEGVLKSVDPSKKIDVGGYHLDKEGNYRSSKTISIAESEIYLSEVMDTICDKMENYVRATSKSNGTLTLLNLLDSAGNMNFQMSEVDIIQDDDLNKSLPFYCSSIIEEKEEDIIQHFREGNVDHTCSNIGLCKKGKSKEEL